MEVQVSVGSIHAHPTQIVRGQHVRKVELSVRKGTADVFKGSANWASHRFPMLSVAKMGSVAKIRLVKSIVIVLVGVHVSMGNVFKHLERLIGVVETLNVLPILFVIVRITVSLSVEETQEAARSIEIVLKGDVLTRFRIASRIPISAMPRLENVCLPSCTFLVVFVTKHRDVVSPEVSAVRWTVIVHRVRLVYREAAVQECVLHFVAQSQVVQKAKCVHYRAAHQVYVVASLRVHKVVIVAKRIAHKQVKIAS